MQMLALVKHLRRVEADALAIEEERECRRMDEDSFSYNWSGQSDIGGVWGKTVEILGYGETGVVLSRRLRGGVAA